MLPLTAIDYLLINAFYARQDARTPVLVGVVCVGIYLLVALTLIGPFKAPGLAFANAVQNSSHALILLVLLERALPGLGLAPALLPFAARIAPAAVFAGAFVFFVWPSLGMLGGLAGLIVAGALGALVYVALLQALGVHEVRAVLGMLRARLRG
jgi:putative peptidoglycan lipid II flippase